MIKLINTILFAFAVSILLASTVWAQSAITPSAPLQDANGYYLIGTAAELYGFAELVNSGNASANAKLTADIVVNGNVLDANGEANTGNFVQWTPIGNDYYEDKVYSGTFDGQGHTVSGLYVSGSSWRVGLIGSVSGSAVVRNLGIVDSYFSSSGNCLGSIVGEVSYNSSVTLANVYSTSTVKGDNYIGGLVGGDGFGSVSVVNSYFAGKTSSTFQSGAYNTHHDDIVSGDFDMPISGTLIVVNTFVLGTSRYGTSVTAGQLSDGTVAVALHYYQDALADGSMFGISDGKTAFSGSLEGVSVTTAGITLHTFDGDATAYSSNYVVGNTTPLPVNVVRSGYKFAGWYDNADFEGDAVTSISSSETGNKEYWAKFERSHSVTFVLNDGYIQTGEIDHYIEGETTALPTIVFKDGASFEGWYTTEDFTGSRYYSIPTTATEDMTFYAKWGAEKTTFYLLQGSEPVNVLYEGENVVYLDKTTMDGYYVGDEYGNCWGGFSGSVNVPYSGGESTLGNGGRAFDVSQSGFYVFTLTDKGEGKWFVSVLYPLENYCTVADIPDQTYTGSAIEPEVTVTNGTKKLVKGTDYTVTYSNNINAGTSAKATITGKGNYKGTIEKTFTINAKTLVTSNVANISAQPYTGSAIEPEVTVTDGTKTLVKGTDYTIEYSNNINAGTAAKVTITGKGNYAGTAEKTFTINAKALAASNVADIAAQTYTGSAFEPEVIVTDGTRTLVKGTDYTVEYSNNINAGTSAKATVKGKGNYDGTIEKMFTINKAVPSYTTPENLSVKCNQTLADITLPTGFVFDNLDAVLTFGENNVTATFTPSDIENYEVVKNIALVVTKTDHEYGTPTYSWSDDGKTCTANAVCKNDNSHTASENATITSEVTTAATCETQGTTTYTATFTNALFETQTKAVQDIAAQGHKQSEAVKENEIAATTEHEGSYDEVVYCLVCHKELSRTTKTIPQLKPEEPGNQDNPEEPGNQDNPEEPGNQDNPEEPGNQDNPEEPGNQDNPEEPGNQDNPEEPGNQDNPEEPGNQDNPEEPGNQDNPEEPGNQDNPEEPGNQDNPENPSDPETPVSELNPQNSVKIWSFEKTVFVENAESEILIADMSGRIVKIVKPENSRMEIRLSNGGVYIVKTGLKTQKIIIR